MKIEIPEDMAWTWPAWKLVESKLASFTEVTEKMSIVDIMRLLDAKEAVSDAEYKLRKKLEKS